jgi:hypothetical protein
VQNVSGECTSGEAWTTIAPSRLLLQLTSTSSVIMEETFEHRRNSPWQGR